MFKQWIAEYVHLFLTDDSGGLFVTAEFMDRVARYIRAAATRGSIPAQATAR